MELTARTRIAKGARLAAVYGLVSFVLSVACQQLLRAPQWVSWCGNSMPAASEFWFATVQAFVEIHVPLLLGIAAIGSALSGRGFSVRRLVFWVTSAAVVGEVMLSWPEVTRWAANARFAFALSGEGRDLSDFLSGAALWFLMPTTSGALAVLQMRRTLTHSAAV